MLTVNKQTRPGFTGPARLTESAKSAKVDDSEKSGPSFRAGASTDSFESCLEAAALMEGQESRLSNQDPAGVEGGFSRWMEEKSETLEEASFSLGETHNALTGRQLMALAKQYDVTNMSRSVYSCLLYDLRKLGAITQREYSDGYAGAAPDGAEAADWPYGPEKIDFLPWIEERGQAWAEASMGAETILPPVTSYAQIYRIFSQIQSAADGTLEARFPEMAAKVKAESVIPESVLRNRELGLPDDFSHMSDYARLAMIKEIHDATDFSGMTAVQKYKLMQDRMEALFPHKIAYRSYMGLNYEEVPYEFNGTVQGPAGLMEKIRREQDRQWASQGLELAGYHFHREAYYKNVPRDELFAAICQRHPGETVADRASLLEELQWLEPQLCPPYSDYGGFAPDPIVNALKDMDRNAVISADELNALIREQTESLRKWHDESLQRGGERTLLTWRDWCGFPKEKDIDIEKLSEDPYYTIIQRHIDKLTDVLLQMGETK